jgi:hypothetical protein
VDSGEVVEGEVVEGDVDAGEGSIIRQSDEPFTKLGVGVVTVT